MRVRGLVVSWAIVGSVVFLAVAGCTAPTPATVVGRITATGVPSPLVPASTPLPTLAPTPTTELPSPTAAPTNTPVPANTLTPTNTPIPPTPVPTIEKATPTREVVKIPENLFPSYGVFNGPIEGKNGEYAGEVLVANLPGKGYVDWGYAYIPGTKLIKEDGGSIKFTKNPDGTFDAESPKGYPLERVEFGKDTMTGELFADAMDVGTFTLKRRASTGKQAVIDAAVEVYRRGNNKGKLGTGEISIETVLKNLTQAKIVLP